MPVSVECQVLPSKLRWYLDICLFIAGAVVIFLLHLPYISFLIWACLPWLFASINRSEIDFDYLRFVQGDLILYKSHDSTRWHWSGEGRCSVMFIEFLAKNADQQAMTIRIWRDSLSDSSWRALNMAFWVNQSHARQEFDLTQ